MASHFVRIIAITMLIVTCMFLPFIPGDYDRLAVTQSSMAQMLGIVGLILVPIGLLWLIYEALRRKKRDWKEPGKNQTYYFAIVALVASGIVAIAISLGAYVNNNRFLGLGTLVVCGYIILKIAANCGH